VAQKSRRITFPFSLERTISCPSRVLSVKFGAEAKGSCFSFPQWGRRHIDDTQKTMVKKYVQNVRFKGTALYKLMSNAKDQSSNAIQIPN
jgi:hypothetical protein